jgi:hypothetical protein
MRPLVQLLVLCGVVSVATSVFAQRTAEIGGAGAVVCGDYLDQRRKESGPINALYQSWAIGYLSGYNQFSPRSPLPQIPSPAVILAYIDKYCRDKPLGYVKWSIDMLIVELGGDLSVPGQKQK